MYIFLGLIVLILIIIISNKIKMRNYEKVSGTIVEFVEENGVHYPVFSFTTKDGRVVTSRNKHIKNGKEILEEASVERVFTLEHTQNFITQTLPIKDVIIFYNKNNPEEFNPKWL